MGPIDGEAEFCGTAPWFCELALQVEAITGLAISARHVSGEPGDPCGSWSALLSFTCASAAAVMVEKHVERSREGDAMHVVLVRAGSGEPTLSTATLLALESLGGTLRTHLSARARARYSTQVSEEEMGRRVARWRTKRKLWSVLIVLFLPVYLPVLLAFGLVFLLVFVALMPLWLLWTNVRAPQQTA